MEILIAIITIGLIGFITYKMIKAGKSEPSVPSGGGSEGKDEPLTDEQDGTPLPKNPKIRE